MEQTGFIPGVGTEVNILRIVEAIRVHMGKEEGKDKTWSLYIDLKSAFDTVDHDILFQKLRQKGIEESLINTIEWMYRQTSIKVGDRSCQVTRGVIQGGVLSPLLFLIAFDDILKELQQIGLRTYAYADDLAITGIGRDDLIMAIRTCEDWTARNKMKINKKKSGIILHQKRCGRGKKGARSDQQYIREIPIVDKYKYLGVYIN